MGFCYPYIFKKFEKETNEELIDDILVNISFDTSRKIITPKQKFFFFNN